MATMSAARTLSVSIGRPPAEVYAFVSNPENLPKWARGLGASILKEGAGWVVATPQGPVRLRFTAQNEFGVLDHYVTLPSGVEVYVPMRVVANGTGSELLFTLFRAPEMSDAQYAADQQLVEQDLRALKALLEQ